MYRTEITGFLPRATTRMLSARVPVDIARLIVDFARDVELPAWDPYGFWAAADAEYSKDGSYGYLPMAQTGLPLF